MPLGCSETIELLEAEAVNEAAQLEARAIDEDGIAEVGLMSDGYGKQIEIS